MREGTHVKHNVTDEPGLVTATTDYLFTAQSDKEMGPWSYVHFDDGLRCWVPDDALHRTFTFTRYTRTDLDTVTIQSAIDNDGRVWTVVGTAHARGLCHHTAGTARKLRADTGPVAPRR